ncbi:hypothetical protein AK830_g5687 [Neonectria ditissima]|uniref:Uncharacterized protein n=1 Tax=Neonectria ditissima TaxID=78410 RepID=A0A0P7B3A3_9HYPO|nr:hypothetical protein AK830_g5687 [Neonectria ditissima]
MNQTCLCEYLGVTCNHPDTFLRIPASIRRRIFLHAGLIVDAYIAYPNLAPLETDDESTIPQNRVVTYTLLHVCRQIREEVEAIILNRNICVYSEDNVDVGLAYLSQISPYACSVLRDVYVHLYTQPSWHEGDRSGPSPLSRDRIRMWQSAAKNILSHASPQRLRLHVICDTGNHKKTAAVLQPLRSFPGVLLELELRLHEGRYDDDDAKLRVLARETALQVQGRNAIADSRPFRFFDLPQKIRQEIFMYTNLITPHRRVNWDPESGFRAGFFFCDCDGSVCLEKNLHESHTMTRCGAYSEVSGDFCMKHNSSYTSRCNHGESPLLLFLTSQAMYKEAIEFFYANNRVIIQPYWTVENAMFAGSNEELACRPGTTGLSDTTENPDTAEQARPAPPYDIDHGEMSRTKYIWHDATKLFLERLGTKTVKLLRTLEIVFPRIDPNSSLSDTDTAFSEWRMAVGYLAYLGAHSDVSSLTLIVHIWATPAARHSMWPVGRTALTLDREAPRLLEPLRALPQLDCLFVHLEWPLHWSPGKLLNDIKISKVPKKESLGCGIGLHYIPRSKESVAEKEVKLEKMVMGPDYDSYSMGKWNELPSQWVRSEWDCAM